MKKLNRSIIVGLLGLSLILCMAGCSKTAANNASIANPMVAVSGTEDFEKLGIDMLLPENASDITYYVIDNSLAEAQFTVDGEGYSLRGGNTTEDISGLYAEFEDEEHALNLDYPEGGIQVRIRYTKDGGALAEWRDMNNTAFALYAANIADQEAFTQLVLECLP